MPPRSTSSLWERFSRGGFERDARLWTSDTAIALSDLASGSALGAPLEKLRGRTVLVSTSDQLEAALALIEIDGIARRLVLCPPDLDPVHLPYVVETAGVDFIVTDGPLDAAAGAGVVCVVPCERKVRTVAVERTPEQN